MRGDASNPADWLAFALRDPEWAKKDLAESEHLRATATLQQAAEKALKSWLIGHGWELVKIHDVAALTQAAIQQGADLHWFLQTATAITEEYFAERYPGDFDPPPNVDEARVFLSDVEKLVSRLFPDLKASE